jgi:nucleoside-diphosphate-sugar epimerase
MHVLVVGASGFVGRALTQALLAAGHSVDGWDRLPGQDQPGLVNHSVDLLGQAPLPDPLGQPWDAAFHLAAYSVPGMAWTEEQIMANLRMTARVYDQLARTSPGCRAVLASSAFVYASASHALVESDPLGSTHPYALSKHLGEVWALSHVDSLEVFIVRPFNLVGPAMAKGLLIPDLLERIRSGESPIRMRGRDDVRDFLDWRDAVEGYLRLLTVTAASGSIWNLCSGRPTRVSELVHELMKAHGHDREVLFDSPGSQTMIGDPSKFMAATGWAPLRSLPDTAEAIAASR